jgi:hypothetical protein
MPEPTPSAPRDDTLPIASFVPETQVVDAVTGEPVGPDADPAIPVVPESSLGNGRRTVLTDLGGLVTAGGGSFLGNAEPGVHETVTGGTVYINEIGGAEVLQPGPGDPSGPAR